MSTPTDSDTPTSLRGPGPRIQKRRKARRADRKRGVLVVLVISLVLGLGAFLASVINFPFGGPGGEPDSPAAGTPQQQTWLVVGSIESDQTGEAAWLSIFSWDTDAARGFILYVPTTTLVEIPGYGGGPEIAGRALSLGKEPLLASTLSNLLGVGFEHVVRISDQSQIALFDAVGGIEVDVTTRVTEEGEDGLLRTVFPEGAQAMNGEAVARYLNVVDASRDEIVRAVRHSEVWSALFAKYRIDGGPEQLKDILSTSADLFVTDAEPLAVSDFLSKFATVGNSEIVFETLPTEAQGIDTGSRLYRPIADSIQSLVERYLAESRPVGAGEPGRRVQILNGNGVPGIGQEVAAVLVPNGFKLVLDANARSFEFPATQIVIYDESERSVSVAQEIKALLGVGEVVISRQQQSVVDVTVVVGLDYLQR